jgi:hypothetical protein
MLYQRPSSASFERGSCMNPRPTLWLLIAVSCLAWPALAEEPATGREGDPESAAEETEQPAPKGLREKPLWEIGAVGGGGWLPDYPDLSRRNLPGRRRPGAARAFRRHPLARAQRRPRRGLSGRLRRQRRAAWYGRSRFSRGGRPEVDRQAAARGSRERARPVPGRAGRSLDRFQGRRLSGVDPQSSRHLPAQGPPGRRPDGHRRARRHLRLRRLQRLLLRGRGR